MSRRSGDVARLECGDPAEVARFDSYVVRGPQADDCWIWRGAIADDGYGRFWVRRDGVARVIRPHRYAIARWVGPVPADLIAMHDRCDNPICVRAVEFGGRSPHVVLGTQAENLSTMGSKGRGGGMRPAWKRLGLDRAQRVARSRALRDAVRDGWDGAAVSAALLHSAHPTLFDAEP